MSLLYRRCSRDLAETEALARRIAPSLRAGDCLTLEGELGVGKTAFARALIAALSEEPPEVTSPTFTLVRYYPIVLAGRPSRLYHADLYRLKHPEELVELGLEEALERGILLVEWPRIAAAILPGSRLRIQIHMEEGSSRRIAFHGDAPWGLRLKGIVEQ